MLMGRGEIPDQIGLRSFGGTFRVPSSKPETQRAIVAASLADGESRIFNDLRCAETDLMKEGCRALGAVIEEQDDHLRIVGVGGRPQAARRLIDAGGSALVLRMLAAISSAAPGPSVLTGDSTLRGRVMAPLLGALGALGAEVEPILGNGCAPLVNWGGGLAGGRCVLPGDVSSQFVTALLFAAPLAAAPVDLTVSDRVFSQSYIRQSLAQLARSGVTVEAADDLRRLRILPGRYRPGEWTVGGDYTSASYLLAAAALLPGRSVLENLDSDSLQGERAILDMLAELGLDVEVDSAARSVTVENRGDSLRGDFEFDVADCPNILPTLAAIGAFVDGRLRITGGRLTRFHKSVRIEAMAAELAALGADIRPILRDGVVDGFEIAGRPGYAGGASLSGHGDHRIFMSLFVASLRVERPCRISGGEDVGLSFPGFFEAIERGCAGAPQAGSEDRLTLAP